MNISENTYLLLKWKTGGLLKWYSLQSRRLNHTRRRLVTHINSKLRNFYNIRKANICSLEHCPNNNGLNLPVIWFFFCEIQKYNTELKYFGNLNFFFPSLTFLLIPVETLILHWQWSTLHAYCASASYSSSQSQFLPFTESAANAILCLHSHKSKHL